MPDDVTPDPLVLADAAVEILPAVDAPVVVICPSCARSLVSEAGALRLATSDDTANLSDSERTALRTQQRAAETPIRRNLKR